jgi:hypothetical protein
MLGLNGMMHIRHFIQHLNRVNAQYNKLLLPSFKDY